MDVSSREVRVQGQQVALAPKEFAILSLLYQRKGEACSYDEIAAAGWPERDGNQATVSPDEIGQIIRRLRRKIETDPSHRRYILNVRGYGYRLSLPDSDQATPETGDISTQPDAAQPVLNEQAKALALPEPPVVAHGRAPWPRPWLCRFIFPAALVLLIALIATAAVLRGSPAGTKGLRGQKQAQPSVLPPGQQDSNDQVAPVPPMLIATIPVGNNPSGVVVNPTTSLIYVINTEGRSVSVINGATNSVVATVGLGSKPYAVAVNPITNRIYVAQYFAKVVKIIDGATNTLIATVAVSGNPTAIDLDPNTNRIYVATIADDSQGGTFAGVSVIDGVLGSPTEHTVVASVPVGDQAPSSAGPHAVAVNAATNRIFVGNSNPNAVSVINGATHSVVATIGVSSVGSIGVNPKTSRIYVTNPASNSVSVVDGVLGSTTENKINATVGVGNTPIGVDINPNANLVYVANSADRTLAVIDGAASKVVATVPLAETPGIIGLARGVAVNPITGRVYVNHQHAHVVLVVGNLPQGKFIPTGSMGTSRNGFTLTRLPNGKVLASGGSGVGGVLASAELYDPVTGKWWPTGSMATARHHHTATLLRNGKVLVAGGEGVSGKYLASAELYDPVSGTWLAAGPLLSARLDHTAVLLNNGAVLVAAGIVQGPGDGFGTASAELYDSDSGAWSPTGSLAKARMTQEGVLLADGRVLIAGGKDRGVTFQNFREAEIYEPATGTWSETGPMAIGRREGFTLTLLPNGKVLVAGGATNWNGPATALAELYDPATGVWEPTSPMPTTRYNHSATLLAVSRVLVSGGQEHPRADGPTTPRNTAIIYDPVANTWSTAANTMGEVRVFYPTVLLLDDRVLVAGGHNCAVALATAELFGVQGTSGVAPPGK